MSVDFAYAGSASYRTYLAGLHQREKIDIAIVKSVRAAVGSVAEIYGGDRPVLRDAVRDLRYVPGSPCEVLTVNLHHACTALDPVAHDMVSAFQSLFDDDTAAPERSIKTSGETSEADQQFARVRALASRAQFADALRRVNAILVDEPMLCGKDRRFKWLRAALLAGVAGQPKSATIVDLPAAEHDLLTIAERAGRARPAEAAAAFVAAGRCAYADGRFATAAAHQRRALDHDPRNAEAHYQLARLARQARKGRAVRASLVAAFGLRFSYALRAASDPLFREDARRVRAGVIAAARRAVAAARDTLREGLARLRFLARHGDRDFPAARLAGFASARAELTRLGATPSRTTLRQALLQLAAADATRAPVVGLARDYCALLRANAETIARRGVEPRRAADPDRVARWLTRAAEISVMATLSAAVAGMFDIAAAAPLAPWHTTASASALGLALTVAVLWLLMHTSFLRRPTRRFFERIVTALQARSRARHERRAPYRIARNRRALDRRIRGIEREFGIT
jgi:hypothetical protein